MLVVVNEKKEAIYKVSNGNDANYDEIHIEISEENEVAEGQRIENLVSFITRLGELNGVKVR